MQRKTKIRLVIAVISSLLIGGGIIFYLMYQKLQSKNQAISEMSQQFELEKEQLTDEYSQLALQYEGYGLRIGNDSLANLLDAQRYKVQRLLEELRTVKASNVKRINELKNELGTLRAIMRQYVIQIDSLNALNKQLQTENKVVTQRYTEEQLKTSALVEEKKALTTKITLASILEARNISVESLTEKGRKATKISKTAQLKFNFVINKNISASTGEKYIYLRILQPDESPLVKKNDNVFLFENKYINYSARRPIEYEGDDVPVTIYWDIEEFLQPGTYRADIFADGYIIGSAKFNLVD
ncbi:MAG TPA: hypothetical protein VFP20_08540 [Bacteroidales bacterium]|nr:hypothetical protein [Bacteroidales bacterium]